MTLQPRLLADYAAAPTPRERRQARAHNRAGQGGLFDELEHQADEPAPYCAACSGEHATSSCPHGTAPTLPLTTEHKGSRAVPARTLHLCDAPACLVHGTDKDRRDGGHYHDAEHLEQLRAAAGPDAAAWRVAELDNSPERVAERRAMFQGFGWTR